MQKCKAVPNLGISYFLNETFKKNAISPKKLKKKKSQLEEAISMAGSPLEWWAFGQMLR